ncbi:MAG: hypothetical protein KKG60_02775, partial [Nanoarchaeota archaeon]|nr:hypothetical protein [Nanoarchaeota archaeon]
MKKEEFVAVATLVGTIIGAGIFGIPYVVQKSGFFTGALVMTVIGLAVVLLYLFLGEVVLRTKGNHQLTGYAGKYLGKWGKKLMLVSMSAGICGALFAYMIGVGNSLSALFGGSYLYYSLGFFVLMGVLLYFGIKTFGNSEMVMNVFVLGAVFVICLFAFGKVNVSNLSGFDITKFFYPYGVILFACIGASSIPLIKEELRWNKKLMRKAIILGGMIPVIIYFIFALIVVGVTGADTTQVATVGLGRAIGEHAVIVGNLLASLTMTTSFLALGFALKEVFRYDYDFGNQLSWGLMLGIPLMLFVFLRGVATFSSILNITGVFAGGIESIIIVLMFFRAKKLGDRKPEYVMKVPYILGGLLVLLFLVGMIVNLV